jgi:4-hydroxy-tetrahydrodipicolinate reductase
MKIALFGYGKMGKEVEQIALRRRHTILLKIDTSNTASITKNDLKECDAAIEFTTPSSVIDNIKKCFDAEIPVVVGTTGWYAQLEEIKNLCREKNGCLFYASNFSIGVNIFFKVNEELAKIMNLYPEYDVSVEEIHHIHKLDSPSGTAITLANQIIKNINRKKRWNIRPGGWKNYIQTPNKKMEEWKNGRMENINEELEIISKRQGEVPGTHIVKYFSPIDDIEIIHTAHNRKGFALGAVLAAEFVQGKKGVFSMEDMMKF